MTKALAMAARLARKDEFAALSDRELIRLFADSADESAFAALVRRHSAMVHGVCKRLLPTEQDAEDACQAVFLVLARKAKSNRWQSSLANWLFTTARRVARNARVVAQRRTRREGTAAVPEAVFPADSLSARELLAALDEELDRLPPRFREPLVLCYLEGLTRDEAATRLGVEATALKGHLERGRKKLGDALAARGCTLGVALLATVATSSAGASLPRFVQLILATVHGTPAATVAALAQEAAVSGIPTTTKITLAALAAASLTFGLASLPSSAGPRPADAPAKAELPPATTLTVRVLSHEGKPVPNATVMQRSRDRRRLVETKLGLTDAAGKILAVARPNTSFVALADGYAVAFSGSDIRGRSLDLKLTRPLPIRGRLVDLQGKPIGGAKVEVVSVYGCDGDDLTPAYNAFRVNPHWVGFARSLAGSATAAPAATVTGDDGRFEVKGVGTNHVVRLRFRAAGIESSGVHVFADPEFAKKARPATDAEKASWYDREHKPAIYGPEFTHPARPEHLIVGTVVDAESGKPVLGVTLWGTTVPPTTGGLSPWGDHAEAKTDEQGRFRLAGLAKAVSYQRPGRDREAKRFLHVRAEGTAFLDQLVTVPDTADFTPVRVEVKLRPALVLTGTLVNKATGKPAHGSAHWAPLATNAELAEGRFHAADLYLNGLSPTKPTGTTIEAGDDGRYRLRVPPGPCVVLARSDDPDALFTAARVRDADTRHLRKREKLAEGVRMSGPRDRPTEQSFATLNMTYPLRWENGYAIVEPAAGAKSADVKIEFDPGATVLLSVVGPDGAAVSGVTLVGHGRYGWPPRVFRSAEIAVGGLEPMGRAEQFYLLHKEKKLCGEVVVQGSEKGKVAVKLRPCASVTGRVVGHDGKPVAGMQVHFQMTDAVANDLLRQKMYRDEASATTDADGRFMFERMFPGVEFDLSVFRPGFRSGEGGTRGITLKPGESRDVGQIQLRDPRKLDAE